MNWIELCIDTTPEGIDAVCARLIALGFAGFEIVDGQDFEKFLEENRRYWDYVDEKLRAQMSGKSRVKLYIADDEAAPGVIDGLRAEMEELRASCPEVNLGSLEILSFKRAEEEWAESWKIYYKAFPVGKRLFVRPTWIDAPCPAGRTEYKSNPGMAFGTGTHESTRLCLILLEKYVKGGDEMLDLGCGSGILSVCALLLGANSALGVDVDQNAAEVAARSANINGVGERFSSVCGDAVSDPFLLKEEKYGVITANIVADVIIALKDTAKKHLKPGGCFIVSGIIDSREAEVNEALISFGFSLKDRLTDGGWCAMAYTV